MSHFFKWVSNSSGDTSGRDSERASKRSKEQAPSEALKGFLSSSILFFCSVATYFLLSACTVESKTESCTLNGKAVDCSLMPKHDSGPKPGESPSPTPASNQGSGNEFSCGHMTCHSGSQFCLRSVTSSDTAATTECPELPLNCSGCDCLSAQAKKLFPTTKNCSGFISCAQQNSIFRITCHIPGT